MESESDQLRVKRRSAKGKFTRQVRTVQAMVENERSHSEVYVNWETLQRIYETLQDRHEAFCETIDPKDEATYEEEEAWMEQCRETYVKVSMAMNDYIRNMDTVISSSDTGTNKDGNVGKSDASEAASVITVESETNDDRSATTLVSGTSPKTEKLATEQHTKDMFESRPSTFKLECSQMPKFSGDVREYAVFRSDFKDLVEPKCSKRDAITLLRNNLSGKAHELIKGMGNDYSAAWGYLDSVYGDPRVVADAITYDITSFKALKDDDDAQFCELCHLVRRSFNTLKDIDRQADLDNNHMLAIIEKKMSRDDRKVWSRKVEEGKSPATLEHLLNWMTVEMKTRMRASALIRDGSPSPSRVNYVASYDDNKVSRMSHRCWICKSSTHWTDECNTFTSMSPTERVSVVKENHACYCCLKRAGKNHTANTCYRRRQCMERNGQEHCKLYHHPLLHVSPHVSTGRSGDSGLIGVAGMASNEAMLPVLDVYVLGGNNVRKSAKLLVDSGAQISLIRTELAEELGLNGKDVTITLNKVGGDEETLKTKRYKLCAQSMDCKQAVNMYAIGIPHITDDVSFVNDLRDKASKLKIPFKDIHRSGGPIDLLVGIDCPGLHTGETKTADSVIARRSPLGWVIFGTDGQISRSNRVLNVQVTKPVDLTEFWNTEAMGVSVEHCTCGTEEMSHVERQEAKLIEDSCVNIGKQWLVPYPWKRCPDDLPDNKTQAMKKLVSTEKKLKNNGDYAKVYHEQIVQMENMKFSRKLGQDEMLNYSGPVHYIAHHAVFKPESKSTPVRIVFNTSASFKGHVLNEYWMKGPDMLNNLFGVLLRFREHKVPICADISKMYHRIAIPVLDQHVHRFLWRDLDGEREPDVYVKTVLTFGDKPAPAMAQIALRKTATDNATEFPAATATLTRNVYMDDICDSVDDIHEATSLTTDIDMVLGTGGFKVKGWMSTVETKSPPSTHDTQSFSEVQVSKSDNTTYASNLEVVEKVLGIKWNRACDGFIFENSSTTNAAANKLTKRTVLGITARIFDPIGLAAAFVIKLKIGMQRIWQRGLDWDQELPEDLRDEWIQLLNDMANLKMVTFERCLTPPLATGLPSLCIFSDASNEAFGACAYLRWQLTNGYYEVRLVSAKSRVSPLKELTIPRLELQAAVMASRLYQNILTETRFSFENVFLFTDSMIVLAWIHSQGRAYKPFVSVRIGEIQNNSDPSQWRHIPGEVNVADDVSRGICVDELRGRWMNGPAFLVLPTDKWPETEVDAQTPNVDSERKKTVLLLQEQESLIDCRKFSDWRRLVRVTAYVLRFCRNIQRKHTDDTEATETDQVLNPVELKDAEAYWIRDAQECLKKGIVNGEFKGLSPFTDDDGLLRVGGRVDKAIVTYDTKHPFLLPTTHWISTLITRHYHNTGHSGVAATVAKTKRTYWIVKAHGLAKSVKHKCVTCRKIEQKTECQIMSELPEARLAQDTPPFYHTSCDYFGPYDVRIGRNKTTKHYGVIFTCLNTRAVHLELATDYSTSAYIQVLRRFFAIRGYPKSMLSDNGSQLVGAQKELRQMIRDWDKESIRNLCAERQMDWRFITPLAPHQNGCAESLVKSCKLALKKAIGDHTLAPFELYTCLQEVANLVNMRPIGRIPNDPDDGSYLCPNDMLLGRASATVPQGPFNESKNPRHRVEFIEQIVNSFWRRWTRDVFPSLYVQKKWHVERRNLQPNDFVMVADPNALRGHWQIGRIVETYPGPDAKVRNIKVKTPTGEYKRSVTKIVVLHPSEGYGTESSGGPENESAND